jgi:hypothetical protein
MNLFDKPGIMSGISENRYYRRLPIFHDGEEKNLGHTSLSEQQTNGQDFLVCK